MTDRSTSLLCASRIFFSYKASTRTAYTLNKYLSIDFFTPLH